MHSVAFFFEVAITVALDIDFVDVFRFDRETVVGDVLVKGLVFPFFEELCIFDDFFDSIVLVFFVEEIHMG